MQTVRANAGRDRMAAYLGLLAAGLAVVASVGRDHSSRSAAASQVTSRARGLVADMLPDVQVTSITAQLKESRVSTGERERLWAVDALACSQTTAASLVWDPAAERLVHWNRSAPVTDSDGPNLTVQEGRRAAAQWLHRADPRPPEGRWECSWAEAAQGRVEAGFRSGIGRAVIWVDGRRGYPLFIVITNRERH